MKSTWFGLYKLHKSSAFPTPKSEDGQEMLLSHCNRLGKGQKRPGVGGITMVTGLGKVQPGVRDLTMV